MKLSLSIVLVVSSSVVVASEEPAPAAEPAYQLEPQLDVSIILVGGGVAAGFFFLDEAPSTTCVPACDRSNVNGFDRWAAGNYDPAWTKVGHVATVASIVFGPVVLTLQEGLAVGANDSVVIGEAILLTSALQVVTSEAVTRPRPRSYGGNEVPNDERTNANAARSFFSGHVANGVASTIASMRTLQRLGRDGTAAMVLGFGLAGSTVVGIARVMGGSHFPSDVVAGAAVGTGFGLLMPWMHSSPVRLAPMADADSGGMMLGGTW